MEEELIDSLDPALMDASLVKYLNNNSFIAGNLQMIIKSDEFQAANIILQQRIQHLSFLVHLLCRLEDFDLVFQEYKIVKVNIHKNKARCPHPPSTPPPPLINFFCYQLLLLNRTNRWLC